MSGTRMTNQRCTCASCGDCRGSGRVWFSFSGEYLGNNRFDDLDQLETCEECGGSGITEECEYCAFQREIDEEEDHV